VRIDDAQHAYHAVGLFFSLQGESSEKREFSWIRLETFGNFRPYKFEHQSPETFRDEKSPHLAGLFSSKKGNSLKRTLPGWGGRIRTSIWRIENRAFSPLREKPQNLFPLKFISNSKRSIFENRIESVKSRAWERNGPFGE